MSDGFGMQNHLPGIYCCLTFLFALGDSRWQHKKILCVKISTMAWDGWDTNQSKNKMEIKQWKWLFTSQHSNQPLMGERGNKTYDKNKEKYTRAPKNLAKMNVNCIMVVDSYQLTMVNELSSQACGYVSGLFSARCNKKWIYLHHLLCIMTLKKAQM